jgi:hypothetical protein
MKSVQCDLCEHEAEGETFEEWVQVMKPHYAQAHADVMASKADLSDEQKKEEKDTRMTENKRQFDAA